MPPVIFLTGIGTDVGKSHATGWLAHHFMQSGLRVATMKPVQTGCHDRADDIAVHRSRMGIPSLPEDDERTPQGHRLTAPQIFAYPASPHLAARLEGRRVDIKAIDDALAILAPRYDTLIMEGAGGLMVPLTDDYLTIDFIADRALPVALVTNGALGSMSNTVLSLEAIAARSIALHSVIFNHHFDADPVIATENLRWMHAYLKRHFPGALFLEMQ